MKKLSHKLKVPFLLSFLGYLCLQSSIAAADSINLSTFKVIPVAKVLVSQDIVLKNTLGQTVTLKRGGDGEPPRGPVNIQFRNDPRAKKGVFEMRFDNHTANFWLDEEINLNERTGLPANIATLKSHPARSGQGIGVQSILNSNPRAPKTLHLLLNDQHGQVLGELEIQSIDD